MERRDAKAAMVKNFMLVELGREAREKRLGYMFRNGRSLAEKGDKMSDRHNFGKNRNGLKRTNG